jgi:hypothetical protein
MAVDLLGTGVPAADAALRIDHEDGVVQDGLHQQLVRVGRTRIHATVLAQQAPRHGRPWRCHRHVASGQGSGSRDATAFQMAGLNRTYLMWLVG